MRGYVPGIRSNILCAMVEKEKVKNVECTTGMRRICSKILVSCLEPTESQDGRYGACMGTSESSKRSLNAI
ncbi:hypothetical protein BPOR_0054g00110 [Botrytis porri]|uniref:Uncharacterized protein n=1 Tax=Botrytis porri TaxID=87229 RepID=A0A4Z1L1P9_9HELO|nr:hypothetical protein BPOR_0054g00110 [Botrytis porri]